MPDAHIIEFSLQVEADFLRPVTRDDANPSRVARQISESFGEFLDVRNTAIVSNDDLFDYSLTLPMFQGAATIILNSQSFSVALASGRNRKALKTMTEVICKLFGIVVNREVRQNRLNFSCIATFDDATEFQSYMKQFVNAAKGVTSGGSILFASAGRVKGELRLTVEKAVAQATGVFISAFIATTDPVTPDLFTGLEERITELLELKELKLALAIE
jgi:hypothetical protein